MASDNGTSPLLLSLLANGVGGSNGLTDPAYLAAMPRMNLAQQMMQESTSAAPAYPMQALARVVSGFVGSKIYDKAFQGLMQAEGSVGPRLAKNLPDGDPLIKVLTATNDDGTPDYATRMQGVDAYKSHLQVIGTPKTVGANEQIGFPGAGNPSYSNTNPTSELGREAQDAARLGFPGGNPLQQALVSDILHRSNPNGVNLSVGPNGAPVAAPVANAGNAAGQVQGAAAAAAGPGQGQGEAAKIGAATPATAAQAGAVAAAQNPALIARAGGVAQAELPVRNAERAFAGNFEQGGTVRLAIPKGSRLPDGSIAQEDSIQEVPITATDRAALLGRLGGPSANAPVAPAAAPIAPHSAIAQPQTAVPPAATPAPVPAPQQQGAAAAPAPHIIGNLPEDPTVAPRLDADTKEVAGDRENATKALQDQALLKQIQDLASQTRTGWGAQQQAEGGRILKAMGASDDTIKQFGAMDPSKGQALTEFFLRNSAAAVRQMGAREPGSVIGMFRNAYPNLGTDAGAVQLQTNNQYMNAKWLSDLANAKSTRLTQASQNYQRTGLYSGLQGFNDDFAKTNNPEDYMHAAEAMSGTKYSPWSKITNPDDQYRIISRIPKGSQFVGPDGQTYTRQ